MILTMYAIKDELNGFTSPIPFMSEELAKRYLDEISSSTSFVKLLSDSSLVLITNLLGGLYNKLYTIIKYNTNNCEYQDFF